MNALLRCCHRLLTSGANRTLLAIPNSTAFSCCTVSLTSIVQAHRFVLEAEGSALHEGFRSLVLCFIPRPLLRRTRSEVVSFHDAGRDLALRLDH